MFLTSSFVRLCATNATERFFSFHYYQRGFFLKIVAISSADIYTRLILNTALYICQLVLNYPCGQPMIAFYFRQKVAVQVKTPDKLNKTKNSLKIIVLKEEIRTKTLFEAEVVGGLSVYKLAS